MKTITAKLNYLHMAPRKVRRVADLMRKKDVYTAENNLKFLSIRAAGPLLKLLKSAVANAQAQKIDKENLFVQSVSVDGGPVLKRWLPRARGSATSIFKRMSHVTLVLGESPNLLTKKRKKAKKVQAVELKAEKDNSAAIEETAIRSKEISEATKSTDLRKKFMRESEMIAKPKSSTRKVIGAFRRIFRRKSI